MSMGAGEIAPSDYRKGAAADGVVSAGMRLLRRSGQGVVGRWGAGCALLHDLVTVATEICYRPGLVQ